MPRWITVDSETSSTLRSRLPELSILELEESSALDHALSRNTTTVAVLPCHGLGQAALAVFRWNRTASVSARESRANTHPGGFLGLSDEPEFEEDQQEKKSWWTRFWEG